jgi:hypothetical protein
MLKNAHTIRLVLQMLLWLMPGIALAAQTTETGRPGDGTAPTEVEVSIFILDITDINSAAQKFTASVYYSASWLDPRLAHDGQSTITRNLSDVWNPRLQVANAQKIFLTMPEIVEITPEGRVLYRQGGWGDYSQSLELQDFPFDRQNFNIHVVAIGYTEAEVLLSQNPEITSGLADDFSEPAWDILSFTNKRHPYTPIANGKSVAGHIVTIDARRNSSYYVQRIIIPLIVIVMASWIVFWLAPQESSQIGVSMTAMLTLIAYRFMISGLLPKIAYMTRLDIFVLAATLLIFATLVEAALCTILVRREKVATAVALDKVCRWLFPFGFLVSGWVAFS